MTISPYITGSIVESIVGLVFVQAGDRANVMTVSCFSEVAHHPTSLWVSINQATYTHHLITESQHFSLVVLHTGQRDVALACGTVSGRERDKLAALPVRRTAQGFFFFDEALASTAVRVRQTVTVDDFTLFVADILEGELNSRRLHRRPLLLSDL